MLAVKSLVQGNSVVTEENIGVYDGREAIITILDYACKPPDSKPSEKR